MTRKLKVEAFRPVARENGSTIRLKGQWLKRLGFAPGSSVELTAVGPGVLEIRLCSPASQLSAPLPPRT
jgi:hypothetical protein